MRTQAHTIHHYDTNRTPIRRGDSVTVVAYNGKQGPRKMDCGVVSRVLGLTTTRVEILDADNARRFVDPRCLMVNA